MNTPRINTIIQQKQSNATVNQMGGAVRVTGCSPLIVDVGMAYGVGVTAAGAPETGTMVGTCVGVGWDVG